MTRRFRISAVALAVALVATGLVAAPAQAASDSTISGTISTTSPGDLDGVYVVAIAWSTGDEYGAEAESSGAYSIADLPADTYQVRSWDSRSGAGTGIAWWNATPATPQGDSIVLDGTGARSGVDIRLHPWAAIWGDFTCANCALITNPGDLYLAAEIQTATGWVGVDSGEFLDHPVPTPYQDGVPRGFTFTSVFAGTLRVVLRDLAKSVPVATSSVVVVAEGGSAQVNLAATLRGPGKMDYTGDGRADVVVRSSDGVLKLYPGNGSGGWQPSRWVAPSWGSATAIARIGSFDGGGSADLVTRDSAGRLWLHPGDGVGHFASPRQIGSGWNVFTRIFSPGDFDGDGNSDLMGMKANGALYLYRGNGAGGWLGGRQVGSGWQKFTAVFGVGDFDGDGPMDVMARRKDGALVLYRGNGAGGWRGSRVVGSGWQIFTALFSPGDFTGDAIPDVLARNAAGKLYLYPSNGSGGWRASTQVGSGWNGITFAN